MNYQETLDDLNQAIYENMFSYWTLPLPIKDLIQIKKRFEELNLTDHQKMLLWEQEEQRKEVYERN